MSPEGHGPRSVSSVLGEWAVVLLAGQGMHCGPAVVAVVLETAHGTTVEGSILSIALNTMTLITHLVLHDIRLHLNLTTKKGRHQLMYLRNEVIHLHLYSHHHRSVERIVKIQH